MAGMLNLDVVVTMAAPMAHTHQIRVHLRAVVKADTTIEITPTDFLRTKVMRNTIQIKVLHAISGSSLPP